MALSNTKPLPLLALLTLFLLLVNRVKSAPSDSLSFILNKFEQSQANLIFQGDAHVPSATRDRIRLINTDSSGAPLTGRTGRILYAAPVHLWSPLTVRQASFETTFSFVITNQAGTTPADGLAFFLAPLDTTIPSDSIGENLGLFNSDTASDPSKNQIVAVEFDTFPNTDLDPPFQHIGIDVNTIRSANVTRWESISGKVVNVRITYNATIKQISVSSKYKSSPDNYAVTYDIDLTTVLPQWVRIGISASTGGLSAAHDVHSWTWSSALPLPPKKKAGKEGKDMFFSDKEGEQDMYIAQYV